MRQSPTNEKSAVTEVKVVDVEKRRAKDSSGKNYEYELKVKWSDESQYNIFRRYSMFFDLRLKTILSVAGLKNLFQDKQHFGITVPELPAQVNYEHYPKMLLDLLVECFLELFQRNSVKMLKSFARKLASPARNDEQIVERYQSVAAFTGSGRGEMSLKENELVTVIEKNNTGHWITIAPYTAKSDDELSYRAGEEVEVLATSNFGWWKIRLRGEVGLTPGSNLTPKSRHDSMDPFMTDEQRRKVNGSFTYNTMQRFLHSTMQQDNWLQLLLQEEHPEGCSDEPHEKSDSNHLQNGMQPHDLDPPMSSTYSSIYASIRAPPPRRESIPQYASVIPKHLRAKPRPRSFSEDIAEEVSLPPGEHFVAITNYSPTPDRHDDMPLAAGETVRLLTEDGPWAFVSAVDATRRRGWVPASILKKGGGLQSSYSRRSMSVGDIYNACLQDEVAMQPKKLLVSSQFPKRPIPTPRSDLEKPSEDPMGAPAEMAPPLPGGSKQNRKPDFTTNNSKCISIRKGEVAQLLEVQPSGWWKMNVEGVDDDEEDDFANNNQKDRSRHSDELWYYGKMSRQKCEELMMRFASFVLSVKYGG
ncbi:SH3 and PX domain-containing protein 2B, partial [Acropora cervicornis]